MESRTLMRWARALIAAATLTSVVCVLAQPPDTTSSASETTAGAERLPRTRRTVFVARLDDQIINPVTARFVVDSIARAEAAGVPLILELDTPGGLLQSTRELVKAILGSRVPVITYVYPNGSRAASAGVFIAMASHLAAMAPGTNIGAAHPVGIGGGWPRRDSKGETTSPVSLPGTDNPALPNPADSIPNAQDIMSEKVMNDTLAWIESIARLRGRNVEWARKAVERSESIIADDAARLNVVDLVAKDLPELLEKIDGRTVTVEGGEFVLATAGASVEYLELNARQRILNVLANPNIAYILLLIGFAGLIYEITHPGLLIPGTVGVICLLLAALALQMLPTNYAAILLILAGIGLIIAEIKITSYGLLTLAGATCLLFGSLALIETQEGFTGVSLNVVLPAVGTLVALLVLLVYLVVRVHSTQVAIGGESFAGQEGEALTDLTPNGKVFFNGTYWDATSSSGVIPKGSRVRVVKMDRLRLFVVRPPSG
jgi:membrane-bound serine protease (ClpP class)